MCLTFCHVRHILFDSDVEDVCGVCTKNIRPEGESCASCKHRRDGDKCALTHFPTPRQRWCCHYNADVVSGWITCTDDCLKGHLRLGGLVAALRLYEAEFRQESDGAVSVDLASLSIPVTYGVPTVHWADELMGAEGETEEPIPEADGEFSLSL